MVFQQIAKVREKVAEEAGPSAAIKAKQEQREHTGVSGLENYISSVIQLLLGEAQDFQASRCKAQTHTPAVLHPPAQGNRRLP